MKRIVVLLATLLLSFGLTNAGNIVDLDPTSWDPDTIRNELSGHFTLSIENDDTLGGVSLGFIITSPDGATWTFDEAGGFATSPAGPKFIKGLPGSRWMTGMALDGSCWDLGGTNIGVPAADVDSFLIGGVGMNGYLASGPMQAMLEIYMTFLGAEVGVPKTVCIDSSKYGNAGDFIFVPVGAPSITPTFNQAGKCYVLFQPEDECPVWDTPNPSAMTINHCGVGQMTVLAHDPEGSQVYYYLIGTTGAGTATVGENNGLVTYTPSPAEACGDEITITVEATDGNHQQGNCEDVPMTINVTITNTAPVITNCPDTVFVGKGNTATECGITATDADVCDVLQFFACGADPINGTVGDPVGAYEVDPVNGCLTFHSDTADGGGSWCFWVCVTDGCDTVRCNIPIVVLEVEPWEVQIAKTHETYQGHFVQVPITMNKGSEAMGGFDFLVSYDASALAFTQAELGSYLAGCGWEYFTYRYGWNGNCGNGCPSGLLRLVGMAETNNGSSHPDMDCVAGVNGNAIAVMTFYVSNDLTLECQKVPIRFYWMDCGDNSISTIGGDTLAINRYIYEYMGDDVFVPIQNYTYGLPGWYGAPSEPCLDGDKVTPIRFIDFINGGVDIVCGDSIDARGDINVNGLAYEVADAVMYTNFFIGGMSAFGTHEEASTSASDVNADGTPLSVADLVYLIRVIIGDAVPYPKPMPDARVMISAQAGSVSVDAPLSLGAALLTFKVHGEIGTPVLGVDMDMKYARENEELHVLIYNIGSKSIPAGENQLVTVPGDVELTGAEVASYEGFMVESMIDNVPTAFALQQNYPNPFNPTTRIAMNMPVESDYSITIFNVVGQKVREYSGHSAAGVVEVVWDGNDANGKAVASGIYFYRATADKFSETKKMVLMK